MTATVYALLLPLMAGSPAPASIAVAPSSRPTPPVTAEATPKSLGAVGLTGILVGAAGVGLVVAGIVRLVPGPARVVSASDSEVIVVSDRRPQGRALLGAGVGVAAIGMAALAFDLTTLGRRRARRVALAPLFDPTTAVLVVHGRFDVNARYRWRPIRRSPDSTRIP